MTNQDLRNIPRSSIYAQILELIDGCFRTELEVRQVRARRAWARRKAAQAAGHQSMAGDGAGKTRR